MSADREYIFKISVFTPDTIPMERLAEYMADLAKLVGHHDKVHFRSVEQGSLGLAYKIEGEVADSSERRLREAHGGEGPRDAEQAFVSLNYRLADDKADAVLIARTGAEIIKFPGAKRAVEPLVHSFGQTDTLDGVIQRLGRSGSNASILIETRDGRLFTVHSYKSTAQALAPYIFGAEVRLTGWATWRREQSGAWLIDNFFVHTYQILEDTKLSEVVEQLRAVEGADWPSLADPWAELAELRHDGGGHPQ